VSNGSLDKYLYDQSKTALDWPGRFHIRNEWKIRESPTDSLKTLPEQQVGHHDEKTIGITGLEL
jgi:hypothetical protein